MENIDTSRMTFLQNVLQYSTANSEPSKDAQPPRPLTPERKEFLENVLASKSVNPIDEMKKCIKCLYDENEEADRKYEALETLRDWCEDINFAIDFHKIDNYKLLPVLVNNNDAEFKALACDFIATLAQNNEYCQKTLIEKNILSLLFDKLENDPADNVKIKALYAVSCLIRDSNEAQEIFLKNGGCDILMKTIDLPNEKFQTKTCFLISSICKNISIKHEFTKLFLIEKLINMYRLTELNIHEHVLSAIISLIDDNPEAIKQAKLLNLDFRNIIANRLLIIENEPRHLEEKENALFLLESLFKN